jgi:hypothetical protein
MVQRLFHPWYKYAIEIHRIYKLEGYEEFIYLFLFELGKGLSLKIILQLYGQSYIGNIIFLCYDVTFKSLKSLEKKCLS